MHNDLMALFELSAEWRVTIHSQEKFPYFEKKVVYCSYANIALLPAMLFIVLTYLMPAYLCTCL